MDLLSSIDDVRCLISDKLGIRHITPADCKRISIEISKDVHKNVSETTIKRIFGFAKVQHKFSQYTVSALFEYIGELNASSEINEEIDAHVVDQQILSKIEDLTNSELKFNSNRCGIPYHMTICREAPVADFDTFFNSEEKLMCFAAAPGYGKTIMINRLVERCFTNQGCKYPDSKTLLLNMGSLYNPEHETLNLEKRIKQLLNITSKTSLINYLDNLMSSSQGKLVIIMDGFNEIALKEEIKDQLFDNVLNFLGKLSQTIAIKVVLSMSSGVWSGFFERLQYFPLVKKTLYKSDSCYSNLFSNVPLLTDKELIEILDNNGIVKGKQLNTFVNPLLRQPLFLKFFFEFNMDKTLIGSNSKIIEHELVAAFALEKIYKSKYYTEKILLLKRLTKLTDNDSPVRTVDKELLTADLHKFKNAYTDLLSDGIITEQKYYLYKKPKEVVRFLEPSLFKYFIFIDLFENNKFGSDEDVMNFISSKYSTYEETAFLVRWVARHYIRRKKYNFIKHIFQFNLTYAERNELVLFIAENIKYTDHLFPSEIKILEKEIHDMLIAELLKLNHTDSFCNESAAILIEFCERDSNYTSYQSILNNVYGHVHLD